MRPQRELVQVKLHQRRIPLTANGRTVAVRPRNDQ